MSDGRTLWYLIKFFAKKEHAEQFMAGRLHMNRLSYFLPLEVSSGDGRGDPHEGVAFWWQPDDLVMKLNLPGIGETTITKNDLAGPVAVAFDHHKHLHVFCMYAMGTHGFECVDGKIDYTPDRADELRAQLTIDERCFRFGDFAVIVPATRFIERVTTVARAAKLKNRLKLVRYFDDLTFHGQVDVGAIPFSKRKEFSYQNEFRICIDNGTMGDDPFTLELGDLREFSALVKSDELNALFKIESIGA